MKFARHTIAPTATMIMDGTLIVAALLIVLYLLYGAGEAEILASLWISLPVVIVMQLIVFNRFDLFHRLWRYASINDLLAVAGSVSVGTILGAFFLMMVGVGLPPIFYILQWFLLIILVGGSRLLIRMLCHPANLNGSGQCVRILIIGAGDAGAMIAREIKQHYFAEKKIIGFIDDDPRKIGRILYDVKVLGNRYVISKVVKDYGIQEIIFAIPSAGGDVLHDVLMECRHTGCKIKKVPGLYELIDGKVTVTQLRDVNVCSLLRREPIRFDIKQVASYITGKRILITGAGGSIGSELCRQVAVTDPSYLVLLGKGENSIYDIHMELHEKYPGLAIQPVIADIRDKASIENAFRRFRPEVVFHAAAHKHVPLMEAQPDEAVRNNIFGTKVVAEAADRSGVQVFVMISTDKAVNPTSVMGATKRVAEMIVQSLNKVSATKYVAVRFGNVLGSRGSVVRLFKQQIDRGGPVTVTHPEMTRYFMTIPEACQLVIQAGAQAKGGEVFVLDMGKPVKIVELAKDLIELSGLRPGKDIEVVFTKPRPGEKLFEELLTSEEGSTATKHEKIFAANLKTIDEYHLQQTLALLFNTQKDEEIIALLCDLIPGYHPARQNLVSTQISRLQEVRQHEYSGSGSYQGSAGQLSFTEG